MAAIVCVLRLRGGGPRVSVPSKTVNLASDVRSSQRFMLLVRPHADLEEPGLQDGRPPVTLRERRKGGGKEGGGWQV